MPRGISTVDVYKRQLLYKFGIFFMCTGLVYFLVSSFFKEPTMTQHMIALIIGIFAATLALGYETQMMIGITAVCGGIGGIHLLMKKMCIRDRCGTDQQMMDKAVEYIKTITTDFEEGQIFTGKVISIKEFGAFLEFAPGKEGMVHISKIAKERINKVEDVLALGDVVKVVCLGKDKMGRISFSMKDVPEEV